MLGLTRKQLEAKQFIAAYAGQNGIPPSFAEIATGIGLRSKGNISRIVKALVDRGHALRGDDYRRSIVIIDGDDAQRVPTHRLPAGSILDFLPPKIAKRFKAHCEAEGDKPHEAIADLVECFLDEHTARKSKQ
jgi:SOS-response transcriptional repressor LexA